MRQRCVVEKLLNADVAIEFHLILTGVKMNSIEKSATKKTSAKKLNDYEYVEQLVRVYFEGDVLERSDALGEIVVSFKPLIVNLMMRYFSRYDEDIYQDAVVFLIERVNKYDYRRFHKFAGYVHWYMDIFFKRQLRAFASRPAVDYDEERISYIPSSDYYSFELMSVLDCLPYKMKCIIKYHVIYGENLKIVARDLKISYPYAKKLKYRAIMILKKQLFI